MLLRKVQKDSTKFCCQKQLNFLAVLRLTTNPMDATLLVAR